MSNLLTATPLLSTSDWAEPKFVPSSSSFHRRRTCQFFSVNKRASLSPLFAVKESLQSSDSGSEKIRAEQTIQQRPRQIGTHTAAAHKEERLVVLGNDSRADGNGGWAGERPCGSREYNTCCRRLTTKQWHQWPCRLRTHRRQPWSKASPHFVCCSCRWSCWTDA